MNTTLKSALALAAVAVATQASAQVTFYEREGFEGRSFGTEQQVRNFERVGFNDRASSAVVFGSRWEVCEDAAFGGRCVVLRPGRYASLEAMGLNDRVSSVRNVSANARSGELRHAPAAPVVQLTLYENEGFAGRAYSTQQEVANFRREGFNDQASSLVVTGGQWEVCDAVGFRGRCVILTAGQYPSLAAMGLNDSVSSVRAVGAQPPNDGAHQQPQPAAAKVTFYEREGFSGLTLVAQQDVGDFRREGFNDLASSAVVTAGQWEVCDAVGFRGRCVVLTAGQYPSLAAMGLNDSVSSVRAVGAQPPNGGAHQQPQPAAASVTFYEREGFSGLTLVTQQDVGDFRRQGFNDVASSAVVTGGRWEVCDAVGFTGRCVVLSPGHYSSLSAIGLNDSVSSVRSLGTMARVDDGRYNAAPAMAYDYRRRADEPLYEARVTAVRAVLGTPEQQRCWIEREQLAQQRSDANVPAAIAGAVIGGILGHQVGGGRGKDLATAGGAVAGALVGANIGRDGGTQQDVQRCTSVPSQARTDYWDVSYSFRGQDYRMQMSSPPGPTVTVNAQGEPRA